MFPGSRQREATFGGTPTGPPAPISDAVRTGCLSDDETAVYRLLEVSQPPTVSFHRIPSPPGGGFAPEPYLSGAQFSSDSVELVYANPFSTAMNYVQDTSILQTRTFGPSDQRFAQDS